MSNLQDLPILDISNGIDPTNIMYRLDTVLQAKLKNRYDEQMKFMVQHKLQRMSTQLPHREIKYRVLIDRNKVVSQKKM